jgi:hypothetical protein
MNLSLPRAVLFAGAALLLFPLGLSAQAPDLTGSPFEGVRKGDRVRLTLKSKQPFSGVVRFVSRDLITLDLRWEKEGAEGTMGFLAELVRKVDVLGALDARELSKRKADRERRLKEAEEELKRVSAEREAVRRADEAARAETAKDTKDAKAAAGDKADLSPAEMEKAVALLKEYPPKDGWGTASDKSIDWLRAKFAVIGAMPTPEEQRFIDNYDLWLKALQLLDKSAAAKGKKGPAVVPLEKLKDTPFLPPTPDGLPRESPPAKTF